MANNQLNTQPQYIHILKLFYSKNMKKILFGVLLLSTLFNISCQKEEADLDSAEKTFIRSTNACYVSGGLTHRFIYIYALSSGKQVATIYREGTSVNLIWTNNSKTYLNFDVSSYKYYFDYGSYRYFFN